MPRSMTGFGRSAVERPDWSHVFEVKSVNSRYLDLKWRLPVFLRSLETEWEKVVREFAVRGRVEIGLNLQVVRAEILGLAFNEPLAAAMIEQVSGLALRMGHGFTPDYNRLLTMSSLWQEASGEPDPLLKQSLEEGLRAALTDWNRSREAEGEATRADLSARLARLGELYEAIRARAPQVKADKTEALKARIVSSLALAGVEADEGRVLQEVVVLSDRLDVSEELSRLASHLATLGKTLGKGGELGKKLDFVLQETFREINTCGNKAQDVEISHLVVDFKTELEKCREQVQNLE